MHPHMVSDTTPENLLVDLSHLAGCGENVAKRTLTALLRVLAQGFEPGGQQSLSDYPMTAWAALAPAARLPRGVWRALGDAGLDEEQGMTVLAVLDDHARRRFGNRAWDRPDRVVADLASEHGLRIPGLQKVSPGGDLPAGAPEAADGVVR